MGNFERNGKGKTSSTSPRCAACIYQGRGLLGGKELCGTGVRSPAGLCHIAKAAYTHVEKQGQFIHMSKSKGACTYIVDQGSLNYYEIGVSCRYRCLAQAEHIENIHRAFTSQASLHGPNSRAQNTRSLSSVLQNMGATAAAALAAEPMEETVFSRRLIGEGRPSRLSGCEFSSGSRAVGWRVANMAALMIEAGDDDIRWPCNTIHMKVATGLHGKRHLDQHMGHRHPSIVVEAHAFNL